MSASVSTWSATLAAGGRIGAAGAPAVLEGLVRGVVGARMLLPAAGPTPDLPRMTAWQPQALWSPAAAQQRFATGLRVVQILCQETDRHLLQLPAIVQRGRSTMAVMQGWVDALPLSSAVRDWIDADRVVEWQFARGWEMAIERQLPVHRPFFRQLHAEWTMGLRVVRDQVHALRRAFATVPADGPFVWEAVKKLCFELDSVQRTHDGILYAMGPSRARYAHLLLTALERGSRQHASDHHGATFHLPYTMEPVVLFEEIDAMWPSADPDPYMAGLMEILGWQLRLADGPGYWIATIDFA